MPPSRFVTKTLTCSDTSFFKISPRTVPLIMLTLSSPTMTFFVAVVYPPFGPRNHGLGLACASPNIVRKKVRCHFSFIMVLCVSFSDGGLSLRWFADAWLMGESK